ncbi:hypothetical protein [Desulfosporosinus youngiae]|uniref:Nucleic acid-binding protein n=1 Tax=Desulfosporosinus youngiae DSM 17734 TaxID=768710 RepID=H5Y283_9FIRM|nr:hypothetical protein [Desulfosporosinus youngiae]EHQ88431.1 hypothetical protein DesyoDRAFT_1263 [Desulfosporosinus youngiae DSM 17734]
MIRVVCNSSPIIGLSTIGKLDLLWTLFDDVMIPEAVFEEIVYGNLVRYTSAIELEKAVLEQKVFVFRVENQSMVEQFDIRTVVRKASVHAVIELFPTKKGARFSYWLSPRYI